MVSGEDKIRITAQDLADPRVDEAVREAKRQPVPSPLEGDMSPAERKKAQTLYPPVAPVPTATPSRRRFRVISSAALYLALAGAAGALVAWALTELLLPPVNTGSARLILLHSVIWFALVGCLTGGAIGSAEGLAAQAPVQAIRSGSLGFFIGILGCAFGAAVAQMMYFVVSADASTPMGFQMIARAAAWGMAGLCLGLAQELALRSGRKIINGLLGGMAGGALGGFLFDPIGMVLGQVGEGLLSRLIGLVILGAAVGAMIGLVEELLKDAWLRVEQGVLAGKQFVIYKNPTVIGSSPKCPIYLFKDSNVEPQHTAIHIVGGHYEVEDLRSQQGTFVNEQPVTRQVLHSGDRIRIGKTVFHYSEKQKGGREDERREFRQAKSTFSSHRHHQG